MIAGRSSFPLVRPQTGVVMSMQPRPLPQVPELTARMARAASRRGNLAMRIRDELGVVYADEQFAAVFATRGRPGISPAQLMIVSVLQFTEDLTDRQAAEAVRDRITWKYALGLELDDPGFDPSVLSEFRDRLVAGDLTHLALDSLLARLKEQGLLTGGGRARTDATHVFAGIRSLHRLDLAGETVRAALEALAAAAPDWLTGVIDRSWQDRYGARLDRLGARTPTDKTKRLQLMITYGQDGYHLLDQVYAPSAPHWLRQIPAVQVLRQVWIQQFYRDVDSVTGRQEVRRREQAPDGDGLPPASDRIVSPYDLDARWGAKRGLVWPDYKVHFTETCNTPTSSDTTSSDTTSSGRAECGDAPNLITNVVTTHASVSDATMTPVIHQQLAAKGLLPADHLVDSAYPSAQEIVAARLRGLTLISPLSQDRSPQARAGGGYDRSAFTIDYTTQTVTCPQGRTSTSWSPVRDRGTSRIVIGWSHHDCMPCPAKTACTKAKSRHINILPRDQHEALTAARTEQSTPQWRTRYATRAGVEGTMRQTTHITGIRHARYRGQPKTALEHTLAATAINLIRLEAYWTGHPLDRTRHTHLSRLDFTTAA